MAFYTTTKEFTEFTALVKPNILIVKANTGSIDLQYQCGSDWITAETYTEDSVKQIEAYGAKIRILVTGDAVYEYV